jgi:putative DNA primase/helicase
VRLSAEFVARRLGQAHLSSSGWWRCVCPVHQSRRPTLALKDGPNGLIPYCHAGCRREDLLEELDRRGLLGADQDHVVDPAEVERQRAKDERRRQKRTAEALDFWFHETADPRGTVVERYWVSRGLSLPLPLTIRASRSWIQHPEGGARPVMTALVELVDHGPVAIHKTWLGVDGSTKASFRSPRLSLGPVSGAAVRLAEAGEMLVVGEGIETAGSILTATGLPAWAALSAGGIERLVLPHLPLAATVIIAADHDETGVGERAARAAAERWLGEGRRARIALPPVPGTDWNDVLLDKDIKGGRDAA